VDLREPICILRRAGYDLGSWTNDCTFLPPIKVRIAELPMGQPLRRGGY
jgi:hypothetical protein